MIAEFLCLTLLDLETNSVRDRITDLLHILRGPEGDSLVSCSVPGTRVWTPGEPTPRQPLAAEGGAPRPVQTACPSPALGVLGGCSRKSGCQQRTP